MKKNYINNISVLYRNNKNSIIKKYTYIVDAYQNKGIDNLQFFFTSFNNGKGSLDYKYEKKNLCTCSSTYRSMVIQISFNLIIV
jgi:hypothetical protein